MTASAPKQTQIQGIGFGRDGPVGNIAPTGQLALAPENLTTLAHVSASSAMNFPKSAGESVIRALVRLRPRGRANELRDR